MNKELQIKRMYKTELAELYGVSLYHIKLMLSATAGKFADTQPFGAYNGRRLLTITQVRMFIEHNEPPNQFVKE